MSSDGEGVQSGNSAKAAERVRRFWRALERRRFLAEGVSVDLFALRPPPARKELLGQLRRAFKGKVSGGHVGGLRYQGEGVLEGEV